MSDHQQKKNSFARSIPWLVPVLGLLAGFWFLGWDAINVHNLAWLKSDASDVYLGWAFLRADPHWHFPLSWTEYIAYPLGGCIAYQDAVPLLSVLLKLFSGLLPWPFQFVGLLGLLNAMLQAVFGYLLCRRFTPDRLLALLGAGFFVLTPACLYRFVGDVVLSTHWPLLAALWIYFLPRPDGSRWRAAKGYAVVLFVSGGIHPYLPAMCLLVILAEAVRSYRQTPRWSLRPLLPWLIPAAALVTSFVLFGYLQFGGGMQNGQGGYGEYGMNLLSPFDPDPHLLQSHSILLPSLPFRPTQSGEYNYLGLGMLGLFAAVLVSLRGKIISALRTPDFFPLGLAALLAFCFAVTHKVTLGSQVLFELPLPFYPFRSALSMFRGSDRFVWIATYIALIFFLRLLLSYWSRRTAIMGLVSLLALQFADLQPLRQTIQAEFHAPRENDALIRDRFWDGLGDHFKKMVVLPAWQTRPFDSALPGGRHNWESLGFVAAGQRLALNTCYKSRNTPADTEMQVNILPREVKAGRLEADTIYVLNPEYLTAFVAGRFDHIAATNVDGLLACWRNPQPSPGNLARLEAMLAQTATGGFDLKQMASGYVFPIEPIPCAADGSFELPARQIFYSDGPASELPVVNRPGQRLRRIVINLEPLVGGPVPAQKFRVSLAGKSLGEFSVTQPGDFTITIPPDFSLGQAAVVPLRFDWLTTTSPDIVKPFPDPAHVRMYRQLLLRLHFKFAAEWRHYALGFHAVKYEFQPE